MRKAERDSRSAFDVDGRHRMSRYEFPERDGDHGTGPVRPPGASDNDYGADVSARPSAGTAIE